MAGEREESQKADPQTREYFIGMKANIKRFDRLRGASQAEPLPTKITVNQPRPAPSENASFHESER